MSSEDIRKKFLDFFKSKGHAIVPSSSLIPTDPSVLFTTAGMQQFKPYYLGEKSPYGNSVASVQKCFRTSDLDSIGDESHLSFFEMLGNFSFNNYFKKEAIEYAHEFITKEMGLKIGYVSVFAGEFFDSVQDKSDGIPPDLESEKIWKAVDPTLKIVKAGKADNFWGPTGSEGPCGPTTEIYINGVEIWNLVFNEYYKDADGKYSLLKTPGVDTGMGLERLAMVAQNKNNVFETDLFSPIMDKLSSEDTAGRRIIADHIKAATFIIADGVTPSNTGRGYALRRLLRRARYYYDSIGAADKALGIFVESIIQIYKNTYPNLIEKKNHIDKIINEEEIIFSAHLRFGKKLLEKIIKEEIIKEKGKISADNAFLLYATYGFPLELIIEIVKEINIKNKSNIEIDIDGFNKKKTVHQELSRTASAGMFKSGLADDSEMATKYHTATHLLLASLRKILGEHVYQKGSNITGERLRFDFSHPEKITAEQIKQVEDLVNEKIRENLAVEMEEISLEEAKKSGAMGVFEGKYSEKVKVYSVGPSTSSGSAFSREICSGPHVENTGVLGKFKIVKEEASSAGVRRIKAILE